MNRQVHFLQTNHAKQERDYLARVIDDKPTKSVVAKLFGEQYWDGSREYGYGGYYYDGRWAQVAQGIVDFYDLKDGSSILDIGCGKGYLLYELFKINPRFKLRGLDISEYAISHAPAEIKNCIIHADAKSPTFSDESFDLVISLNTLHNLKIYDLFQALAQIQKITRSNVWICVESYTNEVQKNNLLNWQLTCESFFSTDEWLWVFERTLKNVDYEFIFFE